MTWRRCAIAHVASDVPGEANFVFSRPQGRPTRPGLPRKQFEKRRFAADISLDAVIQLIRFAAVLAPRRHNNFVDAGITAQAFASLAKHHVLRVVPGGESRRQCDGRAGYNRQTTLPLGVSKREPVSLDQPTLGTSLTANERTNVWTNVRSFAVECEFCEFSSQKFAFAPQAPVRFSQSSSVSPTNQR